MINICASQEAHMGNGIGNENEIVNTEEKGGAGEKGDPGTIPGAPDVHRLERCLPSVHGKP
jgi:hypothetical protein